MKIVDANVLLYAVNADSRHHESSRRWLDAALGGGDTVGFTWIVLTAFVRLTTKIGLFPSPLTHTAAVTQVRDWLESPSARIVEPRQPHVDVWERMLDGVGAGGNLVNDAYLAAIAIDHKATVVSFDVDFGRFPALRWRRPDELTPSV